MLYVLYRRYGVWVAAVGLVAAAATEWMMSRWTTRTTSTPKPTTAKPAK